MQSQRSKDVSVAWLREVPEEKKEAFKEVLRNSSVMKDTLRSILTRELEELYISEAKASSYDTPNWDYLQAHRNGDKARIRSILTLLDF